MNSDGLVTAVNTQPYEPDRKRTKWLIPSAALMARGWPIRDSQRKDGVGAYELRRVGDRGEYSTLRARSEEDEVVDPKCSPDGTWVAYTRFATERRSWSV